MKATVNFKMGSAEYTLEIEESEEMELLHKMIVLGNPPRKCSHCENYKKIKMDSNKDKEGNIYVNVVCLECGAKAKIGRYKTGGYFWHKFEVYNKGGSVPDNVEVGPEELTETEAF